MTHDVVNVERENRASVDCWFVTIDITALDDTGVEEFDPRNALRAYGANNRFGIDVRGQEDSSYVVTWDHLEEQLSVRNLGDGNNADDNAEVGEVLLEVVGV